MGQYVSRHYDLYYNRDVTPFPPDGPKFDPLMGFEGGRPAKVMKASDDELASCGLTHKQRDYCAHLYINYKSCYQKEFPAVWNCEHEVHEYHDCLAKEKIDSYKDYERERRLAVRAKRIASKKAKEEALME